MTILCISMFVLTSVPLTNESFAQRGRRGDDSPRISRHQDRRVVNYPRVVHRRGRRHVISPRIARHGHVVRKLPRGYRRAWHHRKPYFYNRGVFYRRGPSGFIVVSAPRGAIAVSLPVGYQRLWIDGTVYYAYGGTFYRRVPSGYIVTEPPAALVVEDKAPVLVQPSQTATGQVSVDAPVLNVRSGPGLSEPRIYQIHEGYILEVHGKSNGWLYVQLPNGEFGWVKSVFTKPLEPGSG